MIFSLGWCVPLCYVCVCIGVCLLYLCVCVQTKNLLGQAVNQLRAPVCSQFQPVGWLWLPSVERGVCPVPCRVLSVCVFCVCD